MSKKILLGCYQVPGWGGASTSSYKLFEVMRADGLEVSYLNIISEYETDDFTRLFGDKLGNPKGLHNVYNCFLNGPDYGSHPELDDLIDTTSPDIIIGIGRVATLLMKRAAPNKNLIYITTGCEQMKILIHEKQLNDFISFYEYVQTAKNHIGISSRLEKEAVLISDVVITHSNMNLFLYKYFFSPLIKKICSNVIWYAEWIYQDAIHYAGLQRPFPERDIDVIFIASVWNRPEKNYELVKKIVSECRDLNIHIVGETNDKFGNATYHGLLTKREDLFSLLGRAKTIVSPSLFDAAPGILFEASALGCNIIASKNCGNWQICNNNLLVDPFTLNNFLEKISISLSKKYMDDIGYFISTNSYKNLIKTILDL